MLSWSAISQLIGGLGLFLLGMWLLTEGLKLAGGYALEKILAKWTVTRFKSFISGFTLTAIVQSSSAVTVSVIGFINAGLLDLSRSLWVIFGSNVGTSMTAWIVALLGFKFKIDILALPAVGIGAILHLFSSNLRSKSMGGALAGLGLLFLGLQYLQSAFTNVEQMVDLSALFSEGFIGMLSMALIGLVLTATMQSSSAALAIVLTAVATDVLPLSAGAAAVIGANIGTTITALIAVLKANANARRVAVGHVLFNVITALVALLLLGVFLELVQWLQQTLQLDANAAISLALFHTLFNLVGVLLMVLLEPKITPWLMRLFTRSETQTIKPQYLDKNIVAMPDLALNASILDQQRVFSELKPLLLNIQQGFGVKDEHISDLRGLVSAINDYVVQSSQHRLSTETANAFQTVIHINVYLSDCLDNIKESGLLEKLKETLSESDQLIISDIQNQSKVAIKACINDSEHPYSASQTHQKLIDLKQKISETRRFIIEEVRLQRISPRVMDELFRQLTALDRTTEQYVKAFDSLVNLSHAELPGMLEKDANASKTST